MCAKISTETKSAHREARLEHVVYQNSYNSSQVRNVSGFWFFHYCIWNVCFCRQKL